MIVLSEQTHIVGQNMWQITIAGEQPNRVINLESRGL